MLVFGEHVPARSSSGSSACSSERTGAIGTSPRSRSSQSAVVSSAKRRLRISSSASRCRSRDSKSANRGSAATLGQIHRRRPGSGRTSPSGRRPRRAHRRSAKNWNGTTLGWADIGLRSVTNPLREEPGRGIAEHRQRRVVQVGLDVTTAPGAAGIEHADHQPQRRGQAGDVVREREAALGGRARPVHRSARPSPPRPGSGRRSPASARTPRRFRTRSARRRRSPD